MFPWFPSTIVSPSSIHMVVITAPVVMLHPEWWRYMSHQNTRESVQKVLEAGRGMVQCLPEHCFTPQPSPSPRFVSTWFAIYVLGIVAIAASLVLFISTSHRLADSFCIEFVLPVSLTSLCRLEVLWLQTSEP